MEPHGELRPSDDRFLPDREEPIWSLTIIYRGSFGWVTVTSIQDSRDLATGRPILPDRRAKGDCPDCLHVVMGYYIRHEA